MPQMVESMEVALAQWQERNTPLPGNKCRDDSCGGEVVKKVIGSFRGKMETDIPHCTDCGQTAQTVAKHTSMRRMPASSAARNFTSVCHSP